MTQATQVEKSLIYAYYRKLSAVKGQVVLIKDLSKNAEEELWNAKSKVRKDFNKGDESSDQEPSAKNDDTFEED